MVLTKKFSEFDDVDLTDSTNVLVGLSGGVNSKVKEILRWTTATRPSPPFDGLIGYNTDIHEWEYWNSDVSEWKQLLTSSSGENWSEVTVASITTDSSNGYIANRTSTPVNFLLPALAELGDSIQILGKGSSGWSLIANTGQTIIFGDQTTSTEGSISSTQANDNIEVRCITDNVTWTVVGAVGNLTFI